MSIINKIKDFLKIIKIDYNKDITNMNNESLIDYKTELFKEIKRLWINNNNITEEEMNGLLNKLIETSIKLEKEGFE